MIHFSYDISRGIYCGQEVIMLTRGRREEFTIAVDSWQYVNCPRCLGIREERARLFEERKEKDEKENSVDSLLVSNATNSYHRKDSS